MGIDEEVSLLSGSDHVAVRVDTWLEQMENQRKTVQSKVKPLILHQERDLKVVKSIMDKHLMNAIEREKIWMKNAKFSKKSIIVSANLEAYGNAPKPKVKRQNKQLKRLQYQKKSADQKSKKLSLERATIILNHGIWAEEAQNSLEHAIKEGGDLGNEINKKKIELAMSKSNKKLIKETHT